jgi:hypothetical protein
VPVRRANGPTEVVLYYECLCNQNFLRSPLDSRPPELVQHNRAVGRFKSALAGIAGATENTKGVGRGC